MNIGDLLFRGGLWGLVGAWILYFFAVAFLGEDMSSRADSFAKFSYVCFFLMILGTMLKYSGRLRLKYSKKKCIKCSKAAAMGSIYCEFHRKMASKELAFNAGPGTGAEDEDENLGY